MPVKRFLGCFRVTLPKLKQADMEPDITEVTSYLQLAGFQGLTTKNLHRLGVTAVVNCLNRVAPKFDPNEFEYLALPLEDDESVIISKYFQSVTDFIEKQRLEGGTVLVYCGLGISRSPTICLAYCRNSRITPKRNYLMRFHGLTLKEAYQLVQMKRKQICPNNGFFRQLIDYEKQLRGSATVQMISPSKGVECADVVWQELCAEFERTRKIPAPQLDVVKVD